MIVYLILFLSISILFYFDRYKNNINVGYYYFLTATIVTAGFRDMIGGSDVYIYAELYEVEDLSLLLNFPFEKGFLGYYLLLRELSEKREFMFLITSLIIFSLHFKIIKRFSPLVYISIFIYFTKFYLMSFVYLRQGLAMGIIWLSLKYIIDKKYIIPLLIAFIAFLFHKSSILFVPFIFISRYKFSEIQLYILTILFFVLAISPLGNMLAELLAESANSTKVIRYIERSSNINYFYLIEGSILFVLAIKFRAYFYRYNETTIIYNGFILYILILLISLTNATFIRFTWYYFIFVILALPYIYIFSKKNVFRFSFKNLLFLYYTLLFFRLLLLFDGGDFLPYKSIFQDFDRNSIWNYMEYR